MHFTISVGEEMMYKLSNLIKFHYKLYGVIEH